MAREPGTYWTVDRPEAEEVLRRMPTKEGVLMYLLFKRSYNVKGATLDELVRTLDCALKTLDTALRTLKKKKEIVQKGEYFFATLSSSPVPDVVPKSVPDSRKSPPTKPEQDSLFEEHERRGRSLKSLSRAEELENQKLELLKRAFGDDFVLIDEVEGRREAWLALSSETIAGAIEKVTGHAKFRTDLKLELDALANVKAPQSARRSGRGSARTDAPASRGQPDHSGAKPGFEQWQTEQERQRKEDQAQPDVDYASMSKEAFETMLRPKPQGIQVHLRDIRTKQLGDRARRESEQSALASRQRLWAQARELEGGDTGDRVKRPAVGGNLFPSGVSPPGRGYSGQCVLRF